jgi:putative ABC transport system ATP-binding protein
VSGRRFPQTLSRCSGARSLPIELEDVHVDVQARSGKISVVRGVSLRILPAALTVIIGPSGSGKSTLLAVMGLLLAPTRGRVRFQDATVNRWGSMQQDRMRLRSIGFIFQQPTLVRSLTVIENVALPAIIAGRSQDEAIAASRQLLEELRVDDHCDEWPDSLSGGEAQRVVIARALINRPAVILADEPTASLDGENVKIIRDLLHVSATTHRVAVVAVTHDSRVAEAADALYEMADGRLSAVSR